MRKALLIGADPELFVARNGQVSHCIGLLGGSKDAPRKVQGGALQEDNVLFEFNIDPCENFNQFDSRIVQVIEQGKAVLGPEFQVLDKSSHVYSTAELATLPKSAFVFGCDPDYNALTGEMNPAPKSANPGLRTAGGHIHFGVDSLFEVDQAKQREIIILSDYFLGLPSLMLDSNDERRELYGKAGAMRFKNYGAEYRTLSNFWVHNRANRQWAWDQSQKVIANLDNLREIVSTIPPARVQEAINTSNRTMAKEFLKVLKVV